MTDQQHVDVPGQRDWTLDPGRRIEPGSVRFHPDTLTYGQRPNEPLTWRLFADSLYPLQVQVGGIRTDDDGWTTATAFLVGGNAEARAQTRSMAVALLRIQLIELADRGVTVAVPVELPPDPYTRRVLTASLQDTPRLQPAPDPGVLARLNVPAPIEDWWALCDAWSVPRDPDALVRAVQAAAYDRATTAYLADQRARMGA